MQVEPEPTSAQQIITDPTEETHEPLDESAPPPRGPYQIPPFAEYIFRFHEFCCRIVPELYLQIKWIDPRKIQVLSVYFVKQNELYDDPPFLTQAKASKFYFTATELGIGPISGKRPTLFKVTVNPNWETDKQHHILEPINRFPYETFPL